MSRNPVTQRHQCHVFRCDIAAMGIAQAMFDNHAVKRFSQIPKTLGKHYHINTVVVYILVILSVLFQSDTIYNRLYTYITHRQYMIRYHDIIIP